MNNTKESHVAKSNNMDSVVHPPFTSTAGGSNSPVPAAMGMNGIQTMTLGQGSNRNSFWATVVLVNCCEDILEKLRPYAAGNEIFILGATGEVSYVELVNPQEAPVAKTVLQGDFEISSIEGNIVLPKNHDKNQMNRVTVLVAGNDGQIRGGPVRSLIAKSSVQVIISTMSKHAIHNMASKEHWMGNEHPPFPDQAKRMADVVDQIYKATLKELNGTNTYAGGPDW